LGFLTTCCGRGIRDVAACQADGRSVCVVSAGDEAGEEAGEEPDAPADGAVRDRASSVCVRDAFTWAG